MLLSTNVGSHIFRKSKQLLLMGSCVLQEYPKLVDNYARDRVCLHVCLETYHMNMAETKLACIIKKHESTELIVLTVDGSPHCFQLHIIAEDMRRYFNLETAIQHIVIEHGKPHIISGEAVKTARHLHKVQKLINR